MIVLSMDQNIEPPYGLRVETDLQNLVIEEDVLHLKLPISGSWIALPAMSEPSTWALLQPLFAMDTRARSVLLNSFGTSCRAAISRKDVPRLGRTAILKKYRINKLRRNPLNCD